MADNEKYLIRLHGKDIEASVDVYYAYFQMARQERTQDEKLQRNHVVSYDAMDNEGMVGAEAFEDLEAPSMEELIMAKGSRNLKRPRTSRSPMLQPCGWTCRRSAQRNCLHCWIPCRSGLRMNSCESIRRNLSNMKDGPPGPIFCICSAIPGRWMSNSLCCTIVRS